MEHRIQRYFLILSISLVCPCVSRASDTLFKACNKTTKSIVINRTFTSSDTIPLTDFTNIYSLCVDMVIQQPKEDSFVRIVLEDKQGNNYLVAESDRFRNEKTNVRLLEYCEGTSLLNGIQPLQLKCYLSNASFNLTSIHVSENRPQHTEVSEKHREIREKQIEDIACRINAYNEKHKKLWRAGVTPRAMMDYNHLFDTIADPYIANIIYYDEGIYEFGELDLNEQKRERDTLFLPSFDWRTVHGGQKNYITSVKNQDSTNWCATFAVIGMLEAYSNLYYNDTINLDLSEPSVAYYLKNNYWTGSHETTVLNYIIDNGVIDEASLPFQDYINHNMPQERPDGNENVRIANYISMPSGWSSNITSIKDSLIRRGPCTSGFIKPDGSLMSHAMLLVGYDVVRPDSFYIVENPCKFRYVDENDPRIGMTCWIFKDSYGGVYEHGHEGFMYLIMHNYAYMRKPYFIDSKINRRGHSDSEIICEDLDGDGYFNWGIGPKPRHCPAWAPMDDDGDDSDPTRGHRNEYGYCEVLPLNRPLYEYIANDSILITAENRTAYLGVLRGATVTLQAQQTFNNDTKLLVDNGATLILDGIVMNGNHIQPYSGSKVIMNNGAKITKPFEVPLGVELIINKGSIE